MRLDRYFIIGVALVAAVFFMLSAFLDDPGFPEENISAVFRLIRQPANLPIADDNLPASTFPLKNVQRQPVLWGAYAGDRIGDMADFEAKIGQRIDLQAV